MSSKGAEEKLRVELQVLVVFQQLLKRMKILFSFE